jgi:hypothetical protein
MLEVDVEHVLKVLGGADVGVVDNADGAMAVRPTLNLGEVHDPQFHGVERHHELVVGDGIPAYSRYAARLPRPAPPRA